MMTGGCTVRADFFRPIDARLELGERGLEGHRTRIGNSLESIFRPLEKTTVYLERGAAVGDCSVLYVSQNRLLNKVR